MVLGQLGNRVQHALRAFTPRDQRAVKAAADTFRQNPGFDTATAITQLAVGEALVSCLQPDGTPGIVQRVLIAPPASRVGPITPAERRAIMDDGPMTGKYDTPIDRDSAFEILKARAEGRLSSAPAVAPIVAPTAPQPGQAGSPWGPSGSAAAQGAGSPAPGQGGAAASAPSGGMLDEVGGVLGRMWNGGANNRGRLGAGQMMMRSALQSAARSIGTQVAREVIRGVLGGMQR